MPQSSSHAPLSTRSAALSAARLPDRLHLQFEALDSCHRETLQTLSLLDQLVDQLDQHAAEEPVRRLAHQVIQFFNGNARAHHADEERLVFPPLLQGSDAHLVDQVRSLQRDHVWLEQDWLELGLQLGAIATGYNWYDREALRKGTAAFIALYLDHIDLEESLIYPEARRRLSERTNAGAARLHAEQARGQRW
jgi:hemerythrin-like domain-containing protein